MMFAISLIPTGILFHYLVRAEVYSVRGTLSYSQLYLL
jgi:hypothetical protein